MSHPNHRRSLTISPIQATPSIESVLAKDHQKQLHQRQRQQQYHSQSPQQPLSDPPATPSKHTPKTSRPSRQFSSLRKAFRTVLGDRQANNATRLALDTYAVAQAVTPGYVIHSLIITKSQLLTLADEVANALHKDSLMWLHHPDNHEVYVLNTQTLLCNYNNFDRKSVMIFDALQPNTRSVQARQVPHLKRAFTGLLELIVGGQLPLVCSIEDLVPANMATRLMWTLGNLLLDHPAAFVTSAQSNYADLIANQPCWSIQVLLQGGHSEHDHQLEACRLPASLFEYADFEQEEEAKSTDKIDLRQIADSLQERYENALSANEEASTVWDDVVVYVSPFPTTTATISPVF